MISGTGGASTVLTLTLTRPSAAPRLASSRSPPRVTIPQHRAAPLRCAPCVSPAPVWPSPLSSCLPCRAGVAGPLSSPSYSPSPPSALAAAAQAPPPSREERSHPHRRSHPQPPRPLQAHTPSPSSASAPPPAGPSSTVPRSPLPSSSSHSLCGKKKRPTRNRFGLFSAFNKHPPDTRRSPRPDASASQPFPTVATPSPDPVANPMK